MESINKIETLDRRRSHFLKLTTIAFALWYGLNIVAGLVKNPSLEVAVTIVGLASGIFWIVSLIKLVRLGKEIHKDSDARKALNDEFFIYNRHKSYAAGFWALIFAAIIFSALTLYIEIPALIVSKVMIYVGVMSALVATLYYNKA
jgi:hypothetical protein